MFKRLLRQGPMNWFLDKAEGAGVMVIDSMGKNMLLRHKTIFTRAILSKGWAWNEKHQPLCF